MCRVEDADGQHVGTGWLAAIGLTSEFGLIVTSSSVARSIADQPSMKTAFANFAPNPKADGVHNARISIQLEHLGNEDIAIFSIAAPPPNLRGLQISHPLSVQKACHVIGYSKCNKADDRARGLTPTACEALRLFPGFIALSLFMLCSQQTDRLTEAMLLLQVK